jgi:putative ABC transport system ATP-binding protein
MATDQASPDTHHSSLITHHSAIVCRGVTKDFGSGDTRVQVLRGIDLDVPAGELALLVGPSGCGKTTLISIIAGLLEPTDGEVRVLGQDYGQLKGTRLVRFRGANIGFVFQQYNLLPALTAAENAAVPLIIAGWPRAKAVHRAKGVLGELEMGPRVNSLPKNLSGGEQQRVAIARALVHDPRLLVCDEPTAALDAKSGHMVMELLRKVAVQPGRATVVVTHDNRIFELGDRMIFMSDGRIERVTRKGEGDAH